MAIEIVNGHLYMKAERVSPDLGELKIVDSSGNIIYVTIPEHVLSDLLKAAKELAE